MSDVLDRANRRILRLESGDLNPRTVVTKAGAGLVVVETKNSPLARYRAPASPRYTSLKDFIDQKRTR